MSFTDSERIGKIRDRVFEAPEDREMAKECAGDCDKCNYNSRSCPFSNEL